MTPGACPSCGAVNDAATEIGMSDAQPSEGDLSICFACGALAKFTGNGLEVRALSSEELDQALDDAQVVNTQLNLRAFKGATS